MAEYLIISKESLVLAFAPYERFFYHRQKLNISKFIRGIYPLVLILQGHMLPCFDSSVEYASLF